MPDSLNLNSPFSEGDGDQFDLPFEFKLKSALLGWNDEELPYSRTEMTYFHASVLADFWNEFLTSVTDLSYFQPGRFTDPGPESQAVLPELRMVARSPVHYFLGRILHDFTAPNEVPGFDLNEYSRSRLRRPGETIGFSLNFAHSLAAGNRFYMSPQPELICVGQVDQSSFYWGKEFRSVHSEAWLTESIYEYGSLGHSGRGKLKWFGVSVLLPVILAGFSTSLCEPIKVGWRQIEIHREVGSLRGEPCILKGTIQLDLSQIEAGMGAALHSGGRQAICIEQVALRLVGRNPGAVDGIDGKETGSARATFKTQWQISDKKKYSWEYIAALTAALQGRNPPGK